ncbi:TetR/AcrR family transcriptional regulator [Nonomuraea sp. NPDC049714]|uniref:TetR/AcrR family transcriptional regulator n=1 Tax=Nonomuraea sp. NPDC049714 TaxID=3364357 RepID=UPI00379A91AD
MTDQQAAPNGGHKLRSDTRRNRRRLLKAVGELAREAPGQLTMQAVASRAEIGPATAYRYYSSMDDVLAAYVLSVVEELRDFSARSTAEGRPLFDSVVDKWVDLLAEHGPALVQLRSRQGYLERLNDGDAIITAVRDAWNEPVRGLLDDIGLPNEMIEYALFLCNMMFDPREIQDLVQVTDLSRREVITRLTEAYSGALRGWARAG